MVGVIVAAGMSFAAAARAESVLFGTVFSAVTKKPLAEVIVTATSPSLQGEQVVVTDAQGQYRIPALPPGVYTLRFDSESFRPYSRAELTLNPERLICVNVELLPDELIVCSSYPPDIDVASTTTGVKIEEALVQRLAVNRPMDRGGASRTFESLAELAPGVLSDTYGVSINGASSFENVYLVDGLSTNDPMRGVNALPLNAGFIEETEVLTGGYMPEYGRASGGILRARTRSGSNYFQGSVSGYWVPGVLGGTPTPVSGPTWTITGQNTLHQQGALGATLEGPILKDRLWFFAGVAPALTRLEHTRTLNAREPGADVSTPIPGTSRYFYAEQRSLQAMGKLTYLFGREREHQVSLSVITTPTRSGGDGRLTVDPRTGGVRELINGAPGSLVYRELDGDFTATALHYSGAFLDKKLLLEAHAGWSHQRISSQPIGLNGRAPWVFGTTRPITYYEPSADAELYCGTTYSEQLSRCPVTDYETGGDPVTALDTADRYQAHAQASWFLNLLGPHVVKAGLNVEHLAFSQLRTLEGGVILEEGAGQQPVPTYESRTTSSILGGFVQDGWSLSNRLTVNAGVRYDTQLLYTPEGVQSFMLGNQFSPRVGLVVGPLAHGRMKIFAHYAKYGGQLPLGLMSRALPTTRTTSGQGRQVSGVEEPVDPGIIPMSSSELVAGAEYEVLARTRLIATYTHRNLDTVIEDMSLDDGNTYFLGNPGAGPASVFPKAERTYDAVTVALSRVFSAGWLAQVSYTWSRLNGNYDGPFRLGTGWGAPGLQSDFDLVSQMKNRSGLLPNDRTHSIKVFAAREFFFTHDLSASIGLSYQGRSGTPINYLGGHPAIGTGETFVLPRGSSGERTPWVHAIDPSLRVNYRLGSDHLVSLTLEAFNVFDFQAVTRVNENYTYLAVLPLETKVEAGQLTPDMVQRTNGEPLTASGINQDFKKPLQYQAPRQVRLGLRYTF
ncbi:TonB-dependent receptor [Archangium lansingense]|uniref:TonB-dependent receptor n=1 Tax=Archangium lansingense TaxID=2995310 RepID=A0ABT4A4D7_9BACT|nr:TonB-dependent receptor [Archangium lansinium]MCY1076518.1 TonB-dependent receptor [Archangium lansinium]